MARRKAVSLSIPPTLLEEAENVARAEQRELEDLVTSALRRYVRERRAKRTAPARGATSSKPRRPRQARTGDGIDFWNALQEDLKDIPRTAWKAAPRDGSLNVDKYVYGEP